MKYLVFIFFTILSAAAYAQSPSEIFQSAREAYEKGDNNGAINQLRNCETALGKTNPRLESLRSLCYYNLGDWVNASISLNTYFRIAPPSNAGTNAHNDLVALKEKVDAKIMEANKEFRNELDRKRMEEATAYEQQQISEENARTSALRSASASEMYELYKNSSDPEELKAFITMFPNSPRVNDIKFKKFVADGDLDMNAKRWTPAVENYTRALEIKSDATVRSKLTRSRDEQAYELTAQKNTLEGYENYLSLFPLGMHKQDADKVLQKNYLRLAREYVSANNYNQAVFYYKAYQNRYPQGPEIQTVNTELCSYYVAEAKKAEKIRKVNSVKWALELYNNAAQCGMAAGKTHIKSLNQKVKRWSRPDAIFYGWHADEKNLAGIMGGSLNNRKVGIYISARTGAGFFKTAADWETDNKNSLTESIDKDKKFTGEIVPKVVHVNFGLTRKLIHPFWLYAGGGLTINAELRKFVKTSGSNEEYVTNKDEKYTAFNPEGGLFMWLGPFVFRYGINKPLGKYSGPVVQHFGVAFKM
jgi:hypothetical protein